MNNLRDQDNEIHPQQQYADHNKVTRRKWTLQQKIILREKYKQFQDDWDKISQALPGRTSNTCYAMANFMKIIKRQATKKSYSQQEDQKLLVVYEKYDGNWRLIGNQFKKRSATKCRQRFNKLKYMSLKKSWSQQESQRLMNQYELHEGNWLAIKKQFPKIPFYQIFFKYHNYYTQKKISEKKSPEVAWTNKRENTLWTFYEDDKLLSLVQQKGFQWQSISTFFEKQRASDSYRSRYCFLEKMYANDKNRKWSPQQDKRLLLYIESNPFRFGVISRDFKDCTKQDCYLRCRQLMKNDEQLKGKIQEIQNRFRDGQKMCNKYTQQTIQNQPEQWTTLKLDQKFTNSLLEQLNMLISYTQRRND